MQDMADHYKILKYLNIVNITADHKPFAKF